jgi:hypothetical protein
MGVATFKVGAMWDKVQTIVQEMIFQAFDLGNVHNQLNIHKIESYETSNFIMLKFH